MAFEPGRVAQNCEFCGSPALIDYQQINERIPPHGVLPFKIDVARVRDEIRKWWKDQVGAPGRLAKSALVDTVKCLYIPYWTFDAHVHCRWTADAGYYYYEDEDYTDSKGNTQTRRVRHTRWEYAQGELEHDFDDEPIPATDNVPMNPLRDVEPFPTQEAVPYDRAFVSGHVVEQYRVVLMTAAEQVLERMEQRVKKLCAGEIPGDTYQNLEVQSTYSRQTFKHVLVPIWLLTYVYRRKTYQVVVNGYTGKIAGDHPFSIWKVLLAVAILLAVLGGLVWLGMTIAG